MILSNNKIRKANSILFVLGTFLLVFLFVNCSLYAHGKLKPIHSLSFGVHKNPFLNRNYISADTSHNQHIDIIYSGYKYDDELSLNFGWNFMYSITKNISFSTGLNIWTHNNTLRSQKDSLMKYYPWYDNTPIFIRKNSYNLELPLLLNAHWKRFIFTAGIGLHVFSFNIFEYELINGSVVTNNYTYWFEQKSSMEYVGRSKFDFIDWRIETKYRIKKSNPFYLTLGFNSIQEVNVGIEFQLK